MTPMLAIRTMHPLHL